MYSHYIYGLARLASQGPQQMLHAKYVIRMRSLTPQHDTLHVEQYAQMMPSITMSHHISKLTSIYLTQETVQCVNVCNQNI